MHVLRVSCQHVGINVPWQPCDILEAISPWSVVGSNEAWYLSPNSLVLQTNWILDLRMVLEHPFINNIEEDVS